MKEKKKYILEKRENISLFAPGILYTRHLHHLTGAGRFSIMVSNLSIACPKIPGIATLPFFSLLLIFSVSLGKEFYLKNRLRGASYACCTHVKLQREEGSRGGGGK